MITFSSAANVAWRGGYTRNLAAREALAEVVVRVALEPHRDAARHERAEALTGRSRELNPDRVVRQPLAAVPARNLVPQHRPDRAVDVADRHVDVDGLLLLERARRARDELDVERPLEAVLLRADRAKRRAFRQIRLVEDLGEVDALRLPVVEGRLALQPVGTADHLVHRAEAEAGHQLAHVLGDEAEVVLDELRLAVEPLPQLGILRRDADRTRVQVADAHHDAARYDERGRGEAELLGAEERRNHDVAAGLELAVHLDDDAVAEAVEEQHLLRLGEPELPGDSGVLERGQRRCARAAVVARDEDDVGVRLGHARGDRPDTDLGDELDVHARGRVGILQVVDELREIFDRVDVVVRRRRNQRDARGRVPDFRDPGIDLVSRELPALARLGSLSHLDLQVVGVDQVLARDAEAGRGHLLDRAAPRVAVRVAAIPRGIFSAFAGVRLAAEPVHRDGDGLVGFLADRAVRHRTGGKPLEDRLGGLDLFDRDRLSLP